MKRLLIISLALTLFAAPMADDLLVEGFEGAALPSGWQVWEEDPLYISTWIFGLGWHPHSGNYEALHYWGRYIPTVGGDDNWLVTPTLDMTGYENLELSCWFAGDDLFGFPPRVYVMGSNVPSPVAADFIELLDMGDRPTTYEERIADASVFDGESNVTFAVRYFAGPDYEYYDAIWIDDVLVTGDPIVSVESASLGEIKAIYR